MPEELDYNSETRLIRIRVWGEAPIEDWNASRKK